DRLALRVVADALAVVDISPCRYKRGARREVIVGDIACAWILDLIHLVFRSPNVAAVYEQPDPAIDDSAGEPAVRERRVCALGHSNGTEVREVTRLKHGPGSWRRRSRRANRRGRGKPREKHLWAGILLRRCRRRCRQDERRDQPVREAGTTSP